MREHETTNQRPSLNPLLLWEPDCPLLQDAIPAERWNDVPDSPRAMRLAIAVAGAVEAGVDRRRVCRITLGWARVLERLLPTGPALDLLRELLQLGEATLADPAAPLTWLERIEHDLAAIAPDDVRAALSIVLGEITGVSTEYRLKPEASQAWDANLALLYCIHRHGGAAAERVIAECAALANAELYARA